MSTPTPDQGDVATPDYLQIPFQLRLLDLTRVLRHDWDRVGPALDALNVDCTELIEGLIGVGGDALSCIASYEGDVEHIVADMLDRGAIAHCDAVYVDDLLASMALSALEISRVRTPQPFSYLPAMVRVAYALAEHFVSSCDREFGRSTALDELANYY